MPQFPLDRGESKAMRCEGMQTSAISLMSFLLVNKTRGKETQVSGPHVYKEMGVRGNSLLKSQEPEGRLSEASSL